MKKKILFISIGLIIFISVIWISIHIVSSGKFTKWSHTTALEDHFKNGEAMYLSYNFSWKGIGRPTLKQIEFIKKDGTSITQDRDGFQIQPYIEISPDGNLIGAMDEKTAKNEGLINNLLPFEDFEVDGDFRVVLKVRFQGINTDDDISMMKITYKKYGVTQHQNISFDDGILMEKPN
ncbi:hypothetical protein M3152_04580 [Sporosarcina luteola]|uniref:hypothetical protein n=1 Tax=Sporosarcina luteola TaxID=582850 RepID=UPI0020421798|nr:hypothetical protein [Sporosarcina luteola]MCM3636988.1 hypothetical protein [Sporosarcina luteola]